MKTTTGDTRSAKMIQRGCARRSVVAAIVATGRRKPFAAGFTLMEALIASVILAMTISAVTTPFVAAARNQQADLELTVAVSYAQELMEEMLSKPFADPQGGGSVGPELDETTRAAFDNVDDYNEYSDIVTAEAGSISGATFTRSVSAVYVYVSGQDTTLAPSFVRVTVQIHDRDNRQITSLSRLVYDD